MGRQGSGIALPRDTYTDTSAVFVVPLTRFADLGLQWVLYSGAGTATFAVKGTLSETAAAAEPLNWSDPRWALIDVAVWKYQPNDGSGRLSDILPAADNALVALLVQMTVVGTVELEVLSSVQTRGT